MGNRKNKVHPEQQTELCPTPSTDGSEIGSLPPPIDKGQNINMGH